MESQLRNRAVRRYGKFGISYHNLEEMLAERRVDVDRTTLFEWVENYGPLTIKTAYATIKHFAVSTPCARARRGSSGMAAVSWERCA